MISKSAIKMRRWRKKNRERQRENDRRWRKKHLKEARAKYRDWYRRNRKKQLKRNREYIERNRKKVNARIRLHNHGMTQEEHDLRMKQQRNRCAICRKKFRKTPHIDHNHKTKRNRGLLCEDCNLGLGRFKDSIQILLRAIEYLKDSQRESVPLLQKVIAYLNEERTR